MRSYRWHSSQSPTAITSTRCTIPQTFIRKYIWSQDHKVIAIQYALVAIAHRPGRAGDVGADAPAARLPRHVLAHRAAGLLPVHHHARHDHGDLPADRAVPRRLRQLPHPAHVRLAGHGVPVHEHAELLVLPARGAGAGRRPVRAGRTDRRRLDAVSAAGDPARHAGRDAGASSACSPRSRSSSSRSRWAASTTSPRCCRRAAAA